MAHYSGGKLTTARLPVAGRHIDFASIAAIPGTDEVIAGGCTHRGALPGNPDTGIVSVVLQYGG
jgi:hypothetical protein